MSLVTVTVDTLNVAVVWGNWRKHHVGQDVLVRVLSLLNRSRYGFLLIAIFNSRFWFVESFVHTT